MEERPDIGPANRKRTTEMAFDTPGSYTSVEDGAYVLRLMKLEDTADNGYGPGNKWVWHVYYEASRELIKDEDGEPYEFFQFSSAKMGPKSKAGKWFTALLGRDLEKGEDPQAIVNAAMGKYMKALIGNVEEDGITRTKILNCQPMPKAPS